MTSSIIGKSMYRVHIKYCRKMSRARKFESRIWRTEFHIQFFTNETRIISGEQDISFIQCYAKPACTDSLEWTVCVSSQDCMSEVLLGSESSPFTAEICKPQAEPPHTQCWLLTNHLFFRRLMSLGLHIFAIKMGFFINVISYVIEIEIVWTVFCQLNSCMFSNICIFI